MPTVPLSFRHENGEVNEIRFGRVIERLPSAPVEISLVNHDLGKPFEGEIFVAPSEGPSYSGDLQISLDGSSWGSRIEVSIPPGESFPFRARAFPRATPPGVYGRARICVRGQWPS